MVTNVTNFSRSGLSDWVIQRASAVILGLYTVFIIVFLIDASCSSEGGLTYAVWSLLFSKLCVKIFSLLALLSVVAHAWIGLWIIATDYIKPALIRFLFLAGCIIAMFVYLVWGIQILWGV